jgi:hypothetical protein
MEIAFIGVVLGLIALVRIPLRLPRWAELVSSSSSAFGSLATFWVVERIADS